jgi:hypothetical protein
MTSSAWVNGKGQRQATINLGNGDWAWLVMDFKNDGTKVDKARIIVELYGMRDWAGPVIDNQ